MTKPTFVIDAAIEVFGAVKDLTGKDGILTLLIKQLTEVTLNVEIDQHLEAKQPGNCRNGKTSKTLESATGSSELLKSRDRDGCFEPQPVKKNQTYLIDEMEGKSLRCFHWYQLSGYPSPYRRLVRY
ncbi:transposase [Shewanella sp. GXUN23E]|uniref:transposase n=1 Tax=Shewanella sp. GXUN23E TaxID=3422498 RepID=UPI003D7F0037